MLVRVGRAGRIGGLGSRRPQNGPPPLPLDALSAAAAYSTRRLRTAYTGPLMRVRRSSDNAEADVGFGAGGGLDTVALLAHCGAGDGFVTTWYDQSGNGRDAPQATAASQPRVVNAGVVEVMGSRPAVFFTGATDRLVLPGTIPVAFALSVVGAPVGGAGYRSLGTNSSSTQHYLLRSNVNTNTSVFVSSFGASGGTWEEEEAAIFFVDHTDATTVNGMVGKNGAALINTNRNFAVAPACLGNNATAGSQQFGRIPEAIFLPAFSDTDRQTIERNQGAYYDIAVA